MIDGLEWNGAPIPTAEEAIISDLERKYKEDIKYICKQIGIKRQKRLNVNSGKKIIFLIRKHRQHVK